MAVSESALERELATFQEHREALVQSSLGKFVVISGDDIVCVCETYEDALWQGYEKLGVDARFMVRKIEPTDKVHYIYRGSLAKC